MKIIIQKGKVKCDMGRCASKARYSIAPVGASPEMYLNLCEECASKIRCALNGLRARSAVETANKGGREDI